MSEYKITDAESGKTITELAEVWSKIPHIVLDESIVIIDGKAIAHDQLGATIVHTGQTVTIFRLVSGG